MVSTYGLEWRLSRPVSRQYTYIYLQKLKKPKNFSQQIHVESVLILSHFNALKTSQNFQWHQESFWNNSTSRFFFFFFSSLFQSILKVQQNVSLTNIFLTLTSLSHCKSHPGYTQHKYKKCTMKLPFIVYGPPYSDSSFTDPTKLAVLSFPLGQCSNALHLRKEALVQIW